MTPEGVLTNRHISRHGVQGTLGGVRDPLHFDGKVPGWFRQMLAQTKVNETLYACLHSDAGGLAFAPWIESYSQGSGNRKLLSSLRT